MIGADFSGGWQADVHCGRDSASLARPMTQTLDKPHAKRVTLNFSTTPPLPSWPGIWWRKTDKHRAVDQIGYQSGKYISLRSTARREVE
jgi:hypothetical protein